MASSIQSSLFLLQLLLAVVVSLSRADGINLRAERQQEPLRDLRLSDVHAEAADTIFPITVAGGCDSSLIIEAVEEACDCLAVPFLRALLGLGQDDDDHAVLYDRLGQLCSTAWETVEVSDWQHVDPAFTDEFMERFVQGETYLNVETGNLREEQMEAYPTSLSSRATADMVNDFYESRRFQSTILQSFASTTVLQGHRNGGSLVNDEESDMGGGDENSHASSAKKHDICPNSHAVMCCWGRDRQSNDDNGNCKASDCDDADPADNTNLCMTEDEGDIHCHGLAWSSDPNHISAVFKFNNLFYVTLYDHWYKRGYVENSLGSSFDETGVSMCGCVDEMPMVTRADCTQVNSADITFTIEWAKETGLVIEAGTLASIELDECQGYEFGNPKRKENNDLASHVNSMVAEGTLPREAQALIFETLVGYGQPNNNDNDEACALALANQERGKQSQESETEESRSELVESTTMEKRGPALQIVLSIIICLAIVAGVIMAAKSERLRTLLSGRKGDGNDHVEYESTVGENSF